MRLAKKKKLAILRRTRDLLARDHGWTKGTFHRMALGKDGRYIKQPDGNYMKSYCIAGAAHRAALDVAPERFGGMTESEVVKALSIDALAAAKLAEKYPGLHKRYAADPDDFVATYLLNDASRTRQSDVVALLDEKLEEVEVA